MEAVMSQDLTELYNQLKASEERYRELVENANSIILRWNQEGIITFFNEYAQKFFGFSAEEIIGQHVVGTIVPEDESTGRDLRPLMEDICRNPENYALNVNENIKKNGERCWISWTNKVLLNEKGEPVGALSIGSDITKQRQLETELQQAQKMQAIGQLAGGISHDFNNLIHAIIGYAEIIGEVSQQSAVTEQARLIVNTATSAANLTHQLMTFARKGNVQLKHCNLLSLVEDTATILRHTFPRNIRLIHQTRTEDAWFQGDATQMKNALLNMALNARDAMPEGGVFKMEVDEITTTNESTIGEFRMPAGRFLRLRIEDTGQGMTEDVAQHIFEPFFTTKDMTRGAGLGMGLATTYGTMHLHKGAISCISAPGKGTLFELLLPACAAPTSSTFNAPIRKCAPVSMLVVDDEDMVLMYSRQLFSLHGHQVATSNHPFKALEYFREHWQSLDLVILDMLMPDMDGHALFLEMKKIHPEVTAIIASGYSNNQRVSAALDSGIRGYVQKPFTYEVLEAELAKLQNS